MRKRRFIQRLRKVLLTLNLLLLFGCVALIGLLIGGLVSVNRVLPDTTQLSAYRPKLNTVLYATSETSNPSREWTPIARVYRDQYRDPIRLRDVPRRLREAIVAVEDRRFWQHQGVDPLGMVRALWADVRRRKAAQGASTITQQLARSIWLTREKTIARKAKEVLLAVQMERKFSKDEILEMYLNEVYYGHGAYGIASAAEVFYGKSVDELEELTLAQCALLSGLPQRPGAHSPFNHPEAAKRRRNVVLDAMARGGYITPRQAAKAKSEQIQKYLVPRKSRGIESHKAPYFTSEVIKLLSETWGEEMVYNGGLRVYTTLDIRLQRAAEKALEKGVTESLKGRRVSQGALVCIDVHTGRVLAMAGGVGPYMENQWNRATHARPVGSAFKVYVFTTALLYGWGPNSTISADSLQVPLVDGRIHTFRNYDRAEKGTNSLATSLKWSYNCAAVRLLQDVGIDPVVRTASRMMGVPEWRFNNHRYLSLALGPAGLSPLEMATGFSTIASGGFRPKPLLIDTVTDSRGEQLRVPTPGRVPVLHRDVACTMRNMMAQVVAGGTGWRAKLGSVPCAGKTGTNEDWRDAWFVGFTPDLCTAVWVGNDDYRPTGHVTGGGGAAPIWKAFMAEAIKVIKPEREFPKGGTIVGTKSEEAEENDPQTVLVCAATGMRACPYCPATAERAFALDEVPTAECRRHRSPGPAPRPGPVAPAAPRPESVTICVDSGMRATPHCPNTRTDELLPGVVPSGQCQIHGAAVPQ
ncbi:MAG: PBP1A family penicillin-binding protein [Armatimonadota bacterium]|jgi:penicillin-binding protein 1A